ncbi:hypothetical protein [Citrobacter freundii]|nr:hypothetical protein [Citrobacter freundii]
MAFCWEGLSLVQRLVLNLQHGGEMENVKINKPTLLTDGCI